MLRTYEFYEEEYFISRDEIDRISKIISDFEKGNLRLTAVLASLK